ncbi:unnamed protein product [Blepharisma stoltei]|uniref:Uncharacterized protein n=1 Tax=Blepharisma stoltei TaxID=1481888 RepID=A0AAU9J9R6_9CILI|nr:unnamed protein product [Blepharisma stoltei]
MVEHIVDFLNGALFNQYGGLEELSLILWRIKTILVLLDRKEHLVDYSIHSKPKMKLDMPKNHDHEHLERAKTEISDIPNEESRPVSTTSMNPISEKVEEVLSCPFKIRTKAPKIPHELTSEQDIIERLNKVNMKIDRLNAQKSPRRISPINREESIHEYLESFNHTKAPMTPSLGHFSSKMLQDQSPGDEKRIDDGIERKCIEGVIGTYDEMTMNIKIAKVREQDIVIKYGGEQFWEKFIISLYNKILSCDLLNKYFKKSTMESFEGIVTGMFKIINGSLNLELRRRLRAAHYLRGITLEEFYCYADIFDVTLTEFGVDDDDKQGIMSQIRSLFSIKVLISLKLLGSCLNKPINDNKVFSQSLQSIVYVEI